MLCPKCKQVHQPPITVFVQRVTVPEPFFQAQTVHGVFFQKEEHQTLMHLVYDFRYKPKEGGFMNRGTLSTEKELTLFRQPSHAEFASIHN